MNKWLGRLSACWWLIAILLLEVDTAQADTHIPGQVVIPTWGVGSNPQNDYFRRVLALALAKTAADDGALTIAVSPRDYSTQRFMMALQHDTDIDVLWYATSKAREADLLPIRIPLMKNFNEYRVLLIRREDQPTFSAIRGLADLRRLRAGSGADWPSGDVMRDNGINVIPVNNTHLLYPMLKAKRFDFISRNIFEAFDEAQKPPREGLVFEQSLLLRGSVPIYFFVNKNNKALAARIERGLRMAIADGSFDALLEGTDSYQFAQAILHDPKRRVIELTTPSF